MSSPQAPVPPGSKPSKPSPTPSPFGILDLIFFLMVMMSGFRPSRPIDAAHARNDILFRLGCFVIGSIGLLTIGIVRAVRKRRYPQAPAAPVPLAPVNPWDSAATRRALTVPYQTMRAYAIRMEILTLKRQPKILATLLLPLLLIGLLGAVGAFGKGEMAHGLFILVGWVIGGTAFWFLLFTGLLFSRFPRADTVRRGRASLTAEGFYDETPEKVFFYSWSEVTNIFLEDTIFRVVATSNRGNYFPRTAFSSEEAAQRFYEAALRLWKSGGQDWPEDAIIAEFTPSISPEQASVTTLPPPPSFD